MCRIEYLEKSKQLENQLNELKLEIQTLKQQDRQLNALSLYNVNLRYKYNMQVSTSWYRQVSVYEVKISCDPEDPEGKNTTNEWYIGKGLINQKWRTENPAFFFFFGIGTPTK